MDSIDIVDAAIAHDKDSFMAAFNSAISSRVNDALEIRKVELASSLLTPQEEATTDETTTTEIEVSGSDAESIDGNAEATETRSD